MISTHQGVRDLYNVPLYNTTTLSVIWNITSHHEYNIHIFTLLQRRVFCGMLLVIWVTFWLETSLTAVWVWDVTSAGTSQSASSHSRVNTVWPTIKRYHSIFCIQNSYTGFVKWDRSPSVLMFIICVSNCYIKHDNINTHSKWWLFQPGIGPNFRLLPPHHCWCLCSQLVICPRLPCLCP